MMANSVTRWNDDRPEPGDSISAPSKCSFLPRATREFKGKFLRLLGGIAGLSVLLFFSARPVSGKQVQSIEREELARFVKQGQRVKVVLRSGAYGEGKVEQVDRQLLVLNVTKTHDRQELAKGRQEIALERLASVTVSSHKGHTRIWLAAILPATIGTVGLMAAVGSEELQGKYVPIAVALTAGLGVGGYYGGRALDRKEITITFK